MADTPPTNSTEALEAIARSICKAAGDDPDAPDRKGNACWTYYQDEATAALSHLRELQEENARTREERDEAIRDRNAQTEHVLRMARECEDGLAALTELDEAWEAFGVPSNRKTLTLPEQIAAQNAQIEAAEALASTLREENARLREGLERIESEILAVLGGSLKGRTHDVWQRAENSGMHNALGIVRKHRQALTTPSKDQDQ